jgi:hypothetical protein
MSNRVTSRPGTIALSGIISIPVGIIGITVIVAGPA